MNAPNHVTRQDWQKAIEADIQRFNGDSIEASELLAAIVATLKDRYDRDALRDVGHEYEQLKEALEALQETPTEEDWRDLLAEQRYDEWQQAELDKEQQA